MTGRRYARVARLVIVVWAQAVDGVQVTIFAYAPPVAPFEAMTSFASASPAV